MPRFECVDRQWTAGQLEMLAQKTQVSTGDILAQMQEFLNKSCEACRHVLRLLAMDTPAAIVLDETLTNWFGPKNVWESFHMVPSGTLPIADKPPSVALPRRLSPEMLSEFPADHTQDAIRLAVAKRAAGPAEAATVYLHDQIIAAGHPERKRPEALQEITGHCRFVFPLTIEALKTNAAIREQIQAIVERTNRVC
jgi:hypothetical protein